jgi:3,5-epimerase/4-reductase
MSANDNKIFLVYGASGYFGSHLVKWLTIQNLPFVIGKARINQFEQLKQEIEQVKPTWVLCPAGLKGKPNVDWFEKPENHAEAYSVNVQGRMNVVDICKELNIHCTLFTTTFIYNYNEKHPIGDPVGFKEDEPPNWDKLKYVRLAIELEEKLKEHPEILSLRISMPISDDGHPGSLLTKLITYPNIASMPNSFTIIDDLWPFAIKMCLQKVTGTFNFTNPGVISHDEILKMYKEIIKPDHTWNVVPNNGSRPSYFVNTDKLEALFPGQIPRVHDGMRALLYRWKLNQEKEKKN